MIAEELGKAQVITDRQSSSSTVDVGDDHLVAGSLRVGLAIDHAVHLDVEQVDLAVHGVQ